MSDVTLEFSDSEFLENNSDKYKPLAWVEIITEIQPIPGFDNCDMARVSCGNEVIVKKGEFEVGDECVYVSTDTQLPEDSRWEFLRSNKFRVKCKKMRGAWSDGLVLPLAVISYQEQLELMNYDVKGDAQHFNPFGPGYDVTKILGVQKIPEKAMNGGKGGAIFGRAKGNFPPHTPKTDEDNLYGLKPQRLLEAHKGRKFWRSVKMHGSSGTYFLKDGYFGVCSRNLEVQEDDRGEFWKVQRKYDIRNRLEKRGKNQSIQGEVCGPGINGNMYGFKEVMFFVHNIWDIDAKRSLTPKEMIEECNELGLEYCPGEVFTLEHTMEELIEDVEKPSIFNPEVPEEGKVFRLWDDPNDYCDIIRGRLSFKIVSRIFKDRYKK